MLAWECPWLRTRPRRDSPDHRPGSRRHWAWPSLAAARPGAATAIARSPKRLANAALGQPTRAGRRSRNAVCMVMVRFLIRGGVKNAANRWYDGAFGGSRRKPAGRPFGCTNPGELSVALAYHRCARDASPPTDSPTVRSPVIGATIFLPRGPWLARRAPLGAGPQPAGPSPDRRPGSAPGAPPWCR